MRREWWDIWGEFSKKHSKVSRRMYRLNDLASLWQGWVEGGEGSPSTKLSSCNSGQFGQEASQRETWDRRIEDRNYFRFIDEPIILHLWRSCLKFYFEFVCSQFSSIFFFVSDFFFFFPRLGEHIFHSLIKPYIFGWDNVFLHFWDDSVLSILVNKSAILDKIQSVCLFMRLLTL